MNKLTEKNQEKLLAAGEICYNELLQDIEQIKPNDEVPNYNREKLRQAEAAAWRELHRQKQRTRTRRWAMLAACLLLALTAVMLTGKPSVAYQKFWNNLFVKDNGTSISIVSSSTVLLPEDWSGCYLPTEIPPDYTIESAEKNDFGQSIFYTNPDGNYIDFSAYIGDFNAHLDTENCIVEQIIVSGNEGMIRTKYKDDKIVCISINWIADEVLFDVSCDVLSKETLLSIAESVMIAQ